MVALAPIRSAIKQAFIVTAPFQSSVLFTHYSYSGDADDYDGKKMRTASTETVNALISEIKIDIVDGKNIHRATLFVNESALTLALAPDDTAAFNGNAWTIETVGETSPAFVKAIHVRRP